MLVINSLGYQPYYDCMETIFKLLLSVLTSSSIRSIAAFTWEAILATLRIFSLKFRICQKYLLISLHFDKFLTITGLLILACVILFLQTKYILLTNRMKYGILAPKNQKRMPAPN